MAEAPVFETPILNVSKEIHQWGLQSPSQYLLGTLVLKDLPSPNYLTTYDLIKGYLNESDERFRELIFEWGQRVSRRHADASSKREFVYWFALEYQIETALSRLAWMKLHPDQEVPKELPKSYKVLFDRDPHQDQWVKALNSPEHCNESAFQDLLASQIQYEESWSPSQ